MSDVPILELGIGDATPKYNPQLAEVEAEKKQDPAFSLTTLKPEEQTVVKDFMDKIDIGSTAVVMNYGVATQSKLAQFSDNVLQNVKSKDLGEVGRDLSGLVVEIRSIETGEDKSGGILGFLRNAKKSASRMMANYSRVETNIDRIVRALRGHEVTLMKDIAMLEEMFKNNTEYFREITLYIVAGMERLAKFRAEDIPRQREIAQQTGDEAETQKLNDMANMAERFEKKLHDLKLSRMISIQMSPQIRMVQNNDVSLVEQIQSSINNSIPLWKNQMVIALGLANAKKAMAAQNQVTDMTNQLLIKNSEMLKQNSIEVAEAAQRGIVSVETIRKVNDNLIDTINSVIDIQQKGAENRRSAEVELGKIEEDLKKAMLEAGSRQIQ
ncbi:MAG: toxic anion resistance protein [Defluviitaleaceae bacterium]|nr:toxic anion resistance protein [Defluviitaleaceae bacterium]